MVDLIVSGVFPTMSECRAFQVHLANVRSWAPMSYGQDGRAGWDSAGRMMWYWGQDTDLVAGFSRALLHFGADPETVKLSIPSPDGTGLAAPIG